MTLTIYEGTVDDSGEYTIRAKNDFGETSDSLQVTVIYEPPTFDQPLSDLTIMIGDNTTFRCTFHGKPEPQTKWLISGMDVFESDKYHVVTEKNTTSLEVNNVTMDDTEMDYTCKIFSRLGEETSTAKLVPQGLLNAFLICCARVCMYVWVIKRVGLGLILQHFRSGGMMSGLDLRMA